MVADLAPLLPECLLAALHGTGTMKSGVVKSEENSYSR